MQCRKSLKRVSVDGRGKTCSPWTFRYRISENRAKPIFLDCGFASAYIGNDGILGYSIVFDIVLK